MIGSSTLVTVIGSVRTSSIHFHSDGFIRADIFSFSIKIIIICRVIKHNGMKRQLIVNVFPKIEVFLFVYFFYTIVRMSFNTMYNSKFFS